MDPKPAKPPVSVRMTQDEIWEFLTNGHRGIFVTLRRDGMPIALPMSYAVVDGAIYMNTRGKKLLRIRRDARAAFLVETGERWAELKAVHLTGKAEIVQPEPELADRIQTEIQRKYRGTRTPLSKMPPATRDHYVNADRGLVRFTPDPRILEWDNAKLGV